MSLQATKNGFTFIELVVVIAIIMVFAALVAPNLANQKRSRDQRLFVVNVGTLMLRARNRAISDTRTVELAYQEADKRLTLNEMDPNNGSSTEIGSLPEPDGVSASSFRVGSKDGNAGDWKLDFYPDGLSQGGGIAFKVDDQDRTVTVDPYGSVRSLNGTLPDIAAVAWQAGNIAIRQ